MSALPAFDGCDVLEKVRSGPIVEQYRAVQIPLGRPVTIKALGPSILPSSPFAAALEREARLLAKLGHPNIVALHDFVQAGDRMWLVLEHVDGTNLAELQKRAGKLPQAAAVALALAIADGLAHAHARGVVHRDLTPANVLVSTSGDIKLTDFSVASDERLPTAPELLDGPSGKRSLAYASPEQVLGEQPDPRSDLFSLGVVLFELLAGKPPFGGADDPGTMLRIRNEQPAPLTRFVPDLLPALERIVQRCLQKLPAHRFPSARELAASLTSALLELGSTPDAGLRLALSVAGLAAPEPAPESQPTVLRAPAVKVLSVARVLFAAGVLLVGGVAGIQLLLQTRQTDVARAGRGKLELVPESPAYLRVVAEPWADVVVDGQKVETTPFARPIPLRAGIHYVRLEHPHAPPERRTIDLAPGETVLLDVTMRLRRPEGAAQNAARSIASAPEPADSSP
jgi:eukaryotic-like serine/threonine-protein kinase